METAVEDKNVDPENQPSGLDLAYELIPATYDWMVQRLNTMEERIQALIVLSAGFLLTGPALVALAADGIRFDSLWFYLALVAATINLATGAGMRSWGKLKLPEPRVIDSEWLSAEAREFKWASIYWAKRHFDENNRLVSVKAFAAVVMTIAFLLETVFLTVWGMGQAS